MRGYGKAVRRVLALVLLLNLGVAVAKLAAGWRANSISLMGDGAHSLIDATHNVVGLVLVYFASRPPDENHPYGHQKIETVGAFALAGFLIITAFEIAREAVVRFVNPEAVNLTGSTVAVVVVTLLINAAVSTYERREGRRLGSDLLVADSAHTRSDVYVSGGVLAGFVLTRIGYPWADPLIALVVSGVIAVVGYRVFMEAAPVLTDRAVYDPVVVDRLVRDVSGVESVHDIRSRGRPGEAYVQMHLVVDTRDVHEAHDITDEVERVLERELGAKEVFVHVEPEDDDSGPPGSRAPRSASEGA